MNEKENQKGKENKNPKSKPKDKLNPSYGASSCKKDKQKMFENTKCAYCKKGNHTVSSCMKKTIDQMDKILVQHNIALPEGPKKTDYGSKIDDLSRPQPSDR